MRVIREFPSRSGGRGHSVRLGDNGAIFCTCEAGQHEQDCWAVKIIKGEREFDSMMSRIKGTASTNSLFDPSVLKADYTQLQEDHYWMKVFEDYASNFPAIRDAVILDSEKGRQYLEMNIDDGLE